MCVLNNIFQGEKGVKSEIYIRGQNAFAFARQVTEIGFSCAGKGKLCFF